jgi:hypothetical protein
MPLSAAQIPLKTFLTAGSPKIMFLDSQTSFLAKNSYIVHFGLTSLSPEAFVSVQIVSSVCSGTQNILNVPVIQPSLITFGGEDSSSAKSFSLSSDYPGCFVINITDTLRTYHTASLVTSFFNEGGSLVLSFSHPLTFYAFIVYFSYSPAIGSICE